MKTTSLPSARTKGVAGKRGHNKTPDHPQAQSEVIEMVPVVLKLKDILVPIDFSKTATKALHYAVPLAMQFGARITLIHVVELPRLTPGIEYIGIDAVE